MKIFISWSKDRSREAARFLKTWLKDVFPRVVETWMSDDDLAKGGLLSGELMRGLEGARFAILCVTVENSQEPWLTFEAGAIANTVIANTAIDIAALGGARTGREVIESRVCPFFIDTVLRSTALPKPLANFVYAKSYEKDDTQHLVHSINDTLRAEHRDDQDILDQRFDTMWPRLDEHLRQIRENAPPVQKTPSEIAEEYKKVVNEFDHVRRSLELQRKLLARELYPVIINTVMSYFIRDRE